MSRTAAARSRADHARCIARPGSPDGKHGRPGCKGAFSILRAVKRINKRTCKRREHPYYTFISKGKRTYSVEIPVSMVKDARSKDSG